MHSKKRKDISVLEREPGKSHPSRSAIIIPSFNRTDDLRCVLEELNATAGDFDIHVYDDCTPHLEIKNLCGLYMDVSYHRSTRNMGVIGIRNYAMSELRGRYDYLFHLDDDSHPIRHDTIRDAVAYMDANPDVGVLSFPVVGRGERYVGDDDREVFSYIGCANAWRAAAIEDFGLYASLFERQGEEMEHSFRVWKNGFRIVRREAYPVVHWQSPTNRNRRKIQALNSTAYLKWTVINWSGRPLLIELSRWAAFTLRRTFEISWPIWFKDIMHTTRGLRAALTARKPIPRDCEKRIRALYLDYRSSLK